MQPGVEVPLILGICQWFGAYPSGPPFPVQILCLCPRASIALCVVAFLLILQLPKPPSFIFFPQGRG